CTRSSMARVSACKRPVSSEKIPIGSCAFKIRSVRTMSSAARLDANTAGETARAMRARMAWVSSTRWCRSLMMLASDARAKVRMLGRRAARRPAEQRLRLVGRSLVSFGEHGQALQCIVDAAVLAGGIGVEADPRQRPQLVAQ